MIDDYIYAYDFDMDIFISHFKSVEYFLRKFSTSWASVEFMSLLPYASWTIDNECNECDMFGTLGTSWCL